ncbi:MAG: 3'-5' exonuclease, partial [Thermodesulfobacteriota bacterium]
MIKRINRKVWAFDVEWVPDPQAGKLLYKLPEDMPDGEVMQEMWKMGGATEDDPQPYLKTTVCKVVSLSMVTRHEENGEIKVELHSLPSLPVKSKETDEKYIVETFLDTLGNHKPQIVGYNSVSADLKILIQRGIAHGIRAKEFAKRPDKPWEGVDYFSDRSENNVDLMRIISGWGKSTPSLNEIAVVSGIPGKLGVDGQEVAPMWLNGKIDEIVAYNEFDALTTYLLWLRVVHFAG